VIIFARDMLGKALSWLTMQYRQAINEQSTREQVEAYAKFQRESSPTFRMPMFFGGGGIYNLFFPTGRKRACLTLTSQQLP
jgi:hypothetical protein